MANFCSNCGSAKPMPSSWTCSCGTVNTGFVDGIQIGKLSNGQTKIFEVTPGVHKLRVKMNWSFFSGFLRSNEFDFRIEKGDALKFNCDFNFGAFMMITGLFIWKSLFCGFKVMKIEQVP